VIASAEDFLNDRRHASEARHKENIGNAHLVVEDILVFEEADCYARDGFNNIIAKLAHLEHEPLVILQVKRINASASEAGVRQFAISANNNINMGLAWDQTTIARNPFDDLVAGTNGGKQDLHRGRESEEGLRMHKK